LIRLQRFFDIDYFIEIAIGWLRHCQRKPGIAADVSPPAAADSRRQLTLLFLR
jgi:hypothetical protein